MGDGSTKLGTDTVWGTLSDTDILEYVQNGKLICEEFEEQDLKQACYELRAGYDYYDLSNDGEKRSVKEGEIILLKPHQRLVIITKEKLNVPGDILARILTKGSLLSVGISPVCTYADPGFFGKIGIVLQNISNDYIKIESGAPIAKIEFTKLKKPVSKQYHGQHGFETGIWPIHNDMIVKDRDELKTLFPDHNDLDEIEFAFGHPVADILKRILVTERRFLYATVACIILNLVIIGLSMGKEWLSPMANVLLGIITNLIYALVTAFLSGRHSKNKGGK